MKALWSFEPFYQNKNKIKGMHNTLKALTGSASKIEVGFVVTHTESSLSLAFDIPPSERFSHYPRKLIKQEMKNAGVSMPAEKIHIVDYATLSHVKAFEQLLALANNRGAQLIGLFTHSKKGYSRFTIGSFAETAILRSNINLLIINPKSQESAKIKNVFFAYDFTPASKEKLKEVISYCKKIKSHLTVFHHAEVVYAWPANESHAEIKSYRRKVNRTKQWVEEECHRSGLSTEVIVVADFQPTSDLILAQAKKTKADLIVVNAKVGRAAAFMGASITRQVVRGSTLPVLVLK